MGGGGGRRGKRAARRVARREMPAGSRPPSTPKSKSAIGAGSRGTSGVTASGAWSGAAAGDGRWGTGARRAGGGSGMSPTTRMNSVMRGGTGSSSVAKSGATMTRDETEVDDDREPERPGAHDSLLAPLRGRVR